MALAGYAVPASAAVGDRVRTMAIDYTVTADGVLHVAETIDYHFADPDRHGIFRDLVIREPFVDDRSKDQKYEVSNIQVSSPTAPDSFETATTKTNKGRDQVLRIKIGSSNGTVPGEDATYQISYEVRGALRHFADHSELFWDATGSSWDAPLDHVAITVTVPQGVQQVGCFEGPPGSTASCTGKTIRAGRAAFTQGIVVRGEGLTIVAGIKAGAVSNDTPIVVDPPGFLERYGLNLPAALLSLLVAVVAIVAGKLLGRRRRDQRYAGFPPGTVPPEGLAPQTETDRLDEKRIPVAFAPPDITVAEGGLLVDGKADTTEVAATLVDLAVRGAVRIETTDDVRTAVLVDVGIATAPHEKALLTGLFPKQQPGAEVRLLAPAVGDTRPARAAETMVDALRKQVEERRWYTRMPRRSKVVESAGYGWMSLGCGAFLAALAGLIGLIVWMVKFGAPSWLGPAIVVVVPVLAVLSGVLDVVLERRRGRRTALGRALTDQVIGFRQYLTTAEANQLRFEDGEDIFSRYLPWAVVLGLADRWQQLCQQLVESGRLTAAPTWYSGPTTYYESGWTASTMNTTFAQPPAASTGGGTSSGFSTSSSSSSSSSGGGGGGGGGGSW